MSRRSLFKLAGRRTESESGYVWTSKFDLNADARVDVEIFESAKISGHMSVSVCDRAKVTTLPRESDVLSI